MPHYIIEDTYKYYEYIKVKLDGEWYFLNPKVLEGVLISGRIVKKRTRTWIEPCQ